MDATIRIDMDIQRQLKLRSVELRVTQKELANTYILNGLNGDQSRCNLKSIKDTVEVLNMEMNDVDDVLADLDVGEYEILSGEKCLSVDEIWEIIDENRSNTESKVKLTDMLGIVNPLKKLIVYMRNGNPMI